MMVLLLLILRILRLHPYSHIDDASSSPNDKIDGSGWCLVICQRERSALALTMPLT
jgi:hypothetical protein